MKLLNFKTNLHLTLLAIIISLSYTSKSYAQINKPLEETSSINPTPPKNPPKLPPVTSKPPKIGTILENPPKESASSQKLLKIDLQDSNAVKYRELNLKELDKNLLEE